ncbi:hypothetical protein [Streptomyces sp. NPDC007905]
MARSFPEISPRGWKSLGIVLPSLAEVRIALTGGRPYSRLEGVST